MVCEACPRRIRRAHHSEGIQESIPRHQGHGLTVPLTDILYVLCSECRYIFRILSNASAVFAIRVSGAWV